MNFTKDLPIIIDNDPALKWFPINDIEAFKSLLIISCMKGVNDKYPYKPTKNTRYKEDGIEFNPDDIWLDTTKNELWILVTKTKKYMGWFRFKKVLEQAAHPMYKDFLKHVHSKRKINK